MSHLHALLLGLIQGLTEFFPISSSAHLKIVKWLLGVDIGEKTLFFDLICHSGTLLALLFFLRKEVFEVLTSLKKILLFSIALLPLIPAYFLLKPIRLLASDPSYLCLSLFFTSLLLFVATFKKKREPLPIQGEKNFEAPLRKRQNKYFDVLCIGMMQALALIPGISRSGSTITGARFLGWSWVEAARFSFLLSIPAVLGGQFLETWKWLQEPSSETLIPSSCYFVGFTASFLVGSFAVRFVFWIYEKEKVRPFAWYCLGVGLLAWAIFHGKAAAS